MRGERDGAMELDVVDEEGLRIDRARRTCPAISSAMAARSSPVARSAARRDGADLQHAPRLEHLFLGEAVQRRHEAERPGAEHRRPVGDERAGAVARLDHAHRRERLQPGPHRRRLTPICTASSRSGGQPIARTQLAALDQRAHVRDDVLGRDAIAAGGPSSLGVRPGVRRRRRRLLSSAWPSGDCAVQCHRKQ